ncbi:hypothetical protein [Methylocucumis oryzae]|uniref:hypothetical protein n=1 Tax=Methylocucumis oryzae TaxID=1632867 RepID=UPI00308422D3
MIGGLVMIYVAIWIYQSAIKAGVSNIWMWVGICAGAFLASQFLLVDLKRLYFRVDEKRRRRC